MVMAPIIHKISVILSKCDNVIENIKYTCHDQSFFQFESLHKCEK
jgi:hypothetical protein